LQHLAQLPRVKSAHLQHGLTALVDDKRARGLAATFSSPYDLRQKQQRARLKAICAKWASAGFTMLANQEELELRDHEVIIMWRLRLGLSPLPESMMAQLFCSCESHAPLSLDFTHLLDCPDAHQRRGFQLSHDVQKDFIATIADEGGFGVQKEILYAQYEVKPDVVLVGLDGEVKMVDVSYINPTAKSHARAAAAGEQLQAAGQRIKEKIRHYSALAEDFKCAIVPFVLERFGGVSKPARELLKEIANQTEEVSGVKAGPLLSHFKYMLARNIHRCNASMVRLALQSAGNFRLERFIREQDAVR